VYLTQHETELDIDPIAHAEIAADIVGQHPHPIGGDAEHRGKFCFLEHGASAAGIGRVAVGTRVILAKCGARVDRHPGHPANTNM